MKVPLPWPSHCHRTLSLSSVSMTDCHVASLLAMTCGGRVMFSLQWRVVCCVRSSQWCVGSCYVLFAMIVGWDPCYYCFYGCPSRHCEACRAVAICLNYSCKEIACFFCEDCTFIAKTPFSEAFLKFSHKIVPFFLQGFALPSLLKTSVWWDCHVASLLAMTCGVLRSLLAMMCGVPFVSCNDSVPLIVTILRFQ